MKRCLCLGVLFLWLAQAQPAAANPFPASPDPIRDTLEFMQLHAIGSPFEPKILQRLQQLKSQGKFFHRALDGSNLAVWIEIEGAITLNSNVLRLSDNYAQKARECQQRALAEPERSQRLRQQEAVFWRLHDERILELSAALAHEGTHAYLGNTENPKADETAAYNAEAAWLRILWDRLPQHRSKIRDLENNLQESYLGCTDAPIPRTLPSAP